MNRGWVWLRLKGRIILIFDLFKFCGIVGMIDTIPFDFEIYFLLEFLIISL